LTGNGIGKIDKTEVLLKKPDKLLEWENLSRRVWGEVGESSVGNSRIKFDVNLEFVKWLGLGI
jgi:hypothetical protein